MDALYAVHGDCQGHTGAMVYLGNLAVSRFSKEKYINGKISTEGKLIGVENAVAKNIMANVLYRGAGIQDCTQYNYTGQQECHTFRKKWLVI